MGARPERYGAAPAAARARRPLRCASALAAASLGLASLAGASEPVHAIDPAAVSYERRIEIGERTVAMRVLTDRTKPGVAELAAHYDVAAETGRAPGLDLAAIVGLPAELATRGAQPGIRATARKGLGGGTPVEAVTLESELHTPSLADDTGRWRTAVGASLRLGPKTRASLDVARDQPLGSATRASVAAATTQAQVGLEHRVASRTEVLLGAAFGHGRDLRSLRGTVGLTRRF